MVHLDLVPLTPKDVPDPATPAFTAFIDDHFAAANALLQSIPEWNKGPVKQGDVQIWKLPSDRRISSLKDVGVNEYWCARTSTHTSVEGVPPEELYNKFRWGLFVDHSDHERQYIEACKEAECLQVYQKDVAEVWKMSYTTPPPTSPRTFVILLLCREYDGRFINLSLPFDHPDCPPKQGSEKSRVRARYVSIEEVQALDQGVKWTMGTSSDAGGNIPRFVTNSSLPSSIAEDVPSFLKWIGK